MGGAMKKAAPAASAPFANPLAALMGGGAPKPVEPTQPANPLAALLGGGAAAPKPAPPANPLASALGGGGGGGLAALLGGMKK